jgi:hypothetical protein
VGDIFKWMPYVLGALAVVAVIAGILFKYGSDATAAASVGAATSPLNPDADAAFPAVFVTDAVPATAAISAKPA